ncbi:MAG TPA: DUF2298 domain-containing protein [Candidatus Dormibacteraeota bacterium]|nr:DUF2298 domain-containing protein [Candidatus Dormibacteraeota bacterium]
MAILAVVLVWPLLFAVPGWWLAARALPSVSPVGRCGLAVLISVFFSAHLVNALARTGMGFGVPVIIVSAAVLAVSTWLLATQEVPLLAAPARLSWRGCRRAIATHRGGFALGAASALVVGTILELGVWRRTEAGFVSGGWNWSDLFVHVSIASSIQHGNFPPDVPYFAGVPLTYHWFGDFHAAIAATVAGVDVIPVMVFSSALLSGAFAMLVWELTLTLTESRRAANLATVLALFAGGLGFIRLFIDLHSGQGNLIDLVSNRPYDNAWGTDFPYFHIPSVLGTGLLVQRATTYGLPAVVAVVLIVHVCWSRNPAGVLLAGVLAAMLAPFHFFAFAAIYLILVVQLLARRAWRDPEWLRDAALLFAPGLLALPVVIGPALQQHDLGTLRLVRGWPDALPGDGPLRTAFFYATNLGVPFALAIVAACLKRVPHRWWLVGWMVALFAVPNTVQVSFVSFDGSKFFQIMWIPVAILAAWLMRGWPRLLIAPVLLLSVLSPLLIAVWHVRSDAVVLSLAQERAARWIEANTPERSVFVTDAFINSPVDLAGRLRLTTFGPYVANIGYDPAAREADVQAVYCAGEAVAAQVMRTTGATYVLSSGGALQCGSQPPTQFDRSAFFDTVYSDSGVSVWRLRSP